MSLGSEGSSDQRRKVLQLYGAGVLAVVIVVWLKSALVYEMQTSLVVVLTVAGFMALSYVAPPVGAALFISSNPLMGQLSMAHPGVFVQAVVGCSVLGALFLVRWGDGTLRRLATSGRWRWLALLALTVTFGIAFFRAIALPHVTNLGTNGDMPLWTLLRKSNAANVGLWHYVFITRWGIFVAIGALACANAKDALIFFVSLSLGLAAQLVAIPGWFYQEYIKTVCELGGLSSGLQVLNINRSDLGYVSAITFVTAMVMAIHEVKIWRVVLWSAVGTVGMIITVFAGSKGPVLALVAACAGAVAYSSGFNRHLAVFVLVASVSVSMALSLCNFAASAHLEYVTTIKSSLDSRLSLITAVADKLQKFTTEDWILGEGLGASVVEAQVDVGGTVIEMTSGSHNFFLDMLANAGILGVTSIVAAISIMAWLFFRAMAESGSREGILVRRIVLGVLIVVFVKLNVSTAPHVVSLLALLVGVLFALGTPAQRRRIP